MKTPLTNPQKAALHRIGISVRTATASARELRERADRIEQDAYRAQAEAMHDFLTGGGTRRELEGAMRVTRRKFDSEIQPKIDQFEKRWNRKPWGDRRRNP